jgi:hypothetical protein
MQNDVELKFRFSIQYFLTPQSKSVVGINEPPKEEKLISGIFFEQTLEIKSVQEKIKVLTRSKRGLKVNFDCLKRKTQTGFM